jgi:Glyoxalase-like domain
MPIGSQIEPLPTIIGLDHAVVSVHDLDRAARAWAGFGFTLAPKGVHSTHVGTANYTIMLADDYLELLGVITPTDNNISTRDYLANREGLDRAAFTTTDAGQGVAALKARGIDGTVGIQPPRKVARRPRDRSAVPHLRLAPHRAAGQCPAVRLRAQNPRRDLVANPNAPRQHRPAH